MLYQHNPSFLGEASSPLKGVGHEEIAIIKIAGSTARHWIGLDWLGTQAPHTPARIPYPYPSLPYPSLSSPTLAR